MSEIIVEQRSPEWFEIRKGKITSSEIYKIMGEKGFTETAKTYLLEKASEFYGGVVESVSTMPLDWGRELEPIALKHYEYTTLTTVTKASFIEVDKYYGGSPDGLVLPDGIVEVKCPFKSANHFKHGLINTPEEFRKIAPNYYYQCISNMICAKAQWCDFISYDPRVHPDYQMFIYRLPIDELEVLMMKERISQAVEYLEQLKLRISASRPVTLL